MDFVLGLGAQRTGTTWLHRCLQRHPECDLGPIKEYRVWDVLGTELGRSMTAGPVDWWRRPHKELLRLFMRHWPGFYEGFFARRIRGDVRLTGDITPYYALLSASQLADLRSRLEDRGFRVLVIFFMRDPVARCYSAVRYFRQSRDSISQHNPLMTRDNRDLDEMTLLQRAYRDPHVNALTRYELTVQAIESVFAPDECFFGVYEELFDPDEQQRLTEFLGLQTPLDPVGRVENPSAHEMPLDPKIAGEIRDHFASTYDFCRQRFPQTHGLWHQPMNSGTAA